MAACGARLRRLALPDLAERDTDRTVAFSVVELATGELAGEALLWAIDMHNRSAHIGLSLRPAFRGKHLGTDVVRVLCRYAFVIRGLHRLQIDTLADNDAMIGAAIRAGFTREGTVRQSDWVDGRFADRVILGQLAAEWLPAGRAEASSPPSPPGPMLKLISATNN